jgi:ABC-type uncharacterized transport system auxiliary subunit
VGSDTSGISGEYDLKLDVRSFGIDLTATPVAKVALMAKIVDGGGKVVDASLFEGDQAVTKGDDPGVAAQGIDAAFGKASTDLIVWALGAISKAEEAVMEVPAPPLEMNKPPAGTDAEPKKAPAQ